MRVLIFEPDFGGHRLHHVRHLILALQEMAQEPVVALAAGAPATPEFAAHLAELQDRCRIDAWMPSLPPSVFKAAIQRVQALRQSVERCRPDWIYVPSADAMGQVLGARRTVMLPNLPRDIPAEGLMLRGGFAYPQESVRQTILSRIAWSAACRAPWRVMHVLDPIAYEPTVRRGDALAARCRLMPDPVEIHDTFDRVTARSRLGVPTDGRYVGCAGLLDPRKGVDLLIRAFAQSDLHATDRLLLAGVQDQTIRQMLAGPYSQLVSGGRIICLNQTLPMARLLDSLAAMDVVCAPYPRHIGSASIAIRAAAARRPVLAHDHGWMGAMVPRFKLGWICNALDPLAIQRALRDALDQSSNFVPSEAAERFVQFHSIENFRACWTAEIRRHLGMPPAEGHRPWESVVDGVSN